MEVLVFRISGEAAGDGAISSGLAVLEQPLSAIALGNL